MSISFHVNGPALITVDSSNLGYASADGVEVTIRKFTEPVFTDLRGPNVPAEMIGNGAEATISFTLNNYDSAVLNAYLAKRDGGTRGYMGQIGDLMFRNSRMSSLGIAATNPTSGESPFLFYRTMIVDDASVTLSSQIKKWTLVIKAYPDDAGNLYSN